MHVNTHDNVSMLLRFLNIYPDFKGITFLNWLRDTTRDFFDIMLEFSNISCSFVKLPRSIVVEQQ